MAGRSPLIPPTPVAAVVICPFSLYILGPREQVGDWTKDLFRLGLANPSQPLWITAAQPSLVETTLYYDNGAFAEISSPPTSLPLATVLLGLKTARGFQHVFPRRMRKRKRCRCRCCCPCGTFSALVVTKWRALIFFVSSLFFFYLTYFVDSCRSHRPPLFLPPPPPLLFFLHFCPSDVRSFYRGRVPRFLIHLSLTTPRHHEPTNQRTKSTTNLVACQCCSSARGRALPLPSPWRTGERMSHFVLEKSKRPEAKGQRTQSSERR